MSGAAFQTRAPWWVRARLGVDINHPASRRPTIQKYDTTEFVDQVTSQPASSLRFVRDDHWSYPVPASLTTGSARRRLATSVLVHTGLRKLYQPSHSRFYVVVVEVFCDQPGLPRAGGHDDLELNLVMRRTTTTVSGSKKSVRTLSTELIRMLAQQQHGLNLTEEPDRDARDVWAADVAWRRALADDQAGRLRRLQAVTREQGWMVTRAGVGGWRDVDAAPASAPAAEPASEELLPMWRIPPSEDACGPARSRSLWFGVVPTHSSAHWLDGSRTRPKFDDHAIYQVRCRVSAPPGPGREGCPPTVHLSEPTEPFRLAALYDPDGTKNHVVSITAPDLRRLAARAGRRQGAGGVRISTPPGSQLGPVKFDDIPKAGIGTVGGTGGQVCSFAFELFFIVALFLFLLFLPIVVLVFQLWWMLALRFCLPPSASASFDLLAQFFAAPVPPLSTMNAAQKKAMDEVLGVPGSVAALNQGELMTNPARAGLLVEAIDPRTATRPDRPSASYPVPPDPLCL